MTKGSRRTIVVISDPHIVERGGKLHGSAPAARLRSVLSVVRAEHANADRCVLLGDLVHSGTVAEYETLRDELDSLAMPLSFVMGNHDDRNSFRAVFPQHASVAPFLQGVTRLGPHTLVFLDTKDVTSSAGRYCEERRRWLQRVLESESSDSILLFAHHPPISIDIETIDATRIAEDDAEALKQLLVPHRGRIRQLFFGHVHRIVAGTWAGIAIAGIRGTSHQRTRPRVQNGVETWDHGHPFFATIHLDMDQLVVRVQDTVIDRVVPRAHATTCASHGAGAPGNVISRLDQRVAVTGTQVQPDDAIDVPWHTLTRSAAKRELYGLDPEFRLTWDEVRRYTPSEGAQFSAVAAILLFKPEALLGDKVLRALELCAREQFHVAYCRCVAFDARRVTLLWRYQNNTATVDRLRLMTSIWDSRPALAVVLRRARGLAAQPAAVGLSALKGSGFTARQREGTLRHLFAPPNPLLNCVHVSDEPADMIREMGVLFSFQERAELYACIFDTAATVGVQRELARCKSLLGAKVSPHPDESLRRVKVALESAVCGGNAAAGALLTYLGDLECSSAPLDVSRFLRESTSACLELDLWDIYAVATKYVLRTYDGMAQLIPRVPPTDWDVPSQGDFQPRSVPK